MVRSPRVIAFVLVQLIGLPLQLSAQVQQSSGEARVISERLNEWLRALERGDTSALTEIIAPDYSITLSDGRVVNREEDLAPVKSGMRFTSARADSVQIRVIGQAAIVTGHGTYEVSRGNRTMSVQERFSDVWAKRAGRWHPVASASVALRPPRSASDTPVDSVRAAINRGNAEYVAAFAAPDPERLANVYAEDGARLGRRPECVTPSAGFVGEIVDDP